MAQPARGVVAPGEIDRGGKFGESRLDQRS